MLNTTKLRLGAVAAAVAAVAFVTTAAVPAFADPSAGGFKALVGVGSDTIQDVMNGMGSKIPAIGSYDAINPTTGEKGDLITTKVGGPAYVRPNGSGQGIQALSYSISGTQWQGKDITNQVDFARSSSAPKNNGTALTFIPFAQDAVTYAVNQASDFPRNLPFDVKDGNGVRNTTALSLYNIYHCTARQYTATSLAKITINPLLPQSGSGTRTYWEGKLGLDDANLPTCVKDVNAQGKSVQEHDGTTLTSAGDIVPFSIAQYIAQGNHKAIADDTAVNVVERKGQVALGSIDSTRPLIISGTTVKMNPSFPVNRLVYNVVATSRLSESAIASTFVGTSSAVCTNTAVIEQFGFATIGDACGSNGGGQSLTS
jgi:ABC-type phosphate transport system substrate-binding protein